MASNAVYDYAIVGGGIAGLHLATLLARRYPSASIVVIEKNATFGGRISTYTTKKDINIHYESGAGRIAKEHKLVGAYVKKYGLTPIWIPAESQHRHIAANGDIDVNPNDFNELIRALLAGIPASWKRDHFAETTVRAACERFYGKAIVDRIFEEFGYRSETETLRADIAADKFDGFMGEKGNYFVLAEGFSEIPRRLVKEVLEHGVRLLAEVAIKNAVRHDNHWLLKGSAAGAPWSLEAAKVIFTCPRNALVEMPVFRGSWFLKAVAMRPLCRIYARFPLGPGGKAWFAGIPHTTTNSPLRYIIPINPATGVIMITYTDGEDTEKWTMFPKTDAGNKEREDAIMREIRRIFPEKEIPDPVGWSYHPWYDGCSYWLPAPLAPRNIRAAAASVLYPSRKKMPNLYLCGESWSCENQAWVEGALETAENLFRRHLS